MRAGHLAAVGVDEACGHAEQRLGLLAEEAGGLHEALDLGGIGAGEGLGVGVAGEERRGDAS